MIHCLYKSTNTINGRFYIGVHSTDDVGFGTDTWTDPYVGSGKLVSQALKKYGRDAFNVEVVTYHDSEGDAFQAEADVVTEEWLAEHKGMVYNVVRGGGKPPRSTTESGRKAYATRRLRGNDNAGERNGAKQPRARQANRKWHLQHQIAKRPDNREKHRHYAISHNLKPPRDERHVGAMRGHWWITNGVCERVIRANDVIPYGWRRGRRYLRGKTGLPSSRRSKRKSC